MGSSDPIGSNHAYGRCIQVYADKPGIGHDAVDGRDAAMAALVRALGMIDLLGALGLILPALLRISPILTPWAAVGVIALMLCAIVFHISRGEASDIGINIFSVLLAVYVAWGRFKKHPVVPANVSIQ